MGVVHRQSAQEISISGGKGRCESDEIGMGVMTTGISSLLAQLTMADDAEVKWQAERARAQHKQQVGST